MAARKHSTRRRTPMLSVEKDFEGSIDRMIDEMDPKYLVCRDLRHRWQARDAILDEQGRYYEQVIACSRCTVTKTRIVDARNGQLVQRKGYEYPERYLVKGTGGMTEQDRDTVRLRSIQSRVR